MKTILHMAVSVDGYVARVGGETDWVSELDFALFEKRCTDMGCVIMGRTTFDEVGPKDRVTTIVLTHKKKKSNDESVHYVTSALDALGLAESKGYEKVLIAGGGQVSGLFLGKGLLDELFITVHPIALGSGIKLFAGLEEEAKLELLDTKSLGEGVIQLHYRAEPIDFPL
jgi:dihydrofolate reductase